MVSILNSLGIFNDNIIDKLKEIFNNNNITFDNEPNDDHNNELSISNEDDNDDLSSDNSLIIENKDDNVKSEDKDSNNENIINNNYQKLSGEELNLINGDIILLEKIEKKYNIIFYYIFLFIFFILLSWRDIYQIHEKYEV